MRRFLRISVALASSAAVAYTALMAVVPGAASAATQTPKAATVPVAAARAASPAYGPARRTLTLGMQGSDVRALQQRLTQLKYFPGAVNGVFGSNTLEAVWAFQEVQGLSTDGAVGPQTERALVSPHAPQSRYPGGGSLRVEVNLSRRVLVLYRNHQVALISHISAGGGYYYCSTSGCGHAITPTGHYTTQVFMPGWVTVPLGEMYNPVFFIGTAYAIHGDTYVPLQPASHGCVRIPMDIATFFHNLVNPGGTPVYVYN
jgi:peptidoglycan hydrolase-like protein with peptidoglycan-binding domain